MSSWLKNIVVAMILPLIGGCSTVAYVSESALGHWSLLNGQRPINDVLSDDSVPQSLKDRLRYVRQATAFAHEELLLPDNGSYSSYVQLDRDYVSWVVFVADPFKLELHNWCFWFLGCVPYRGYFSKQDAIDFAQTWRARNYDTYVVGVPAYSTLGWFADPLLSSMLADDDLSTAALIFHELAHQKIYIKGDTIFNESFAKAVEWIGLQKWASLRDESMPLERYAKRQQFIQELTESVLFFRDELEQGYAAAQGNKVLLMKNKARLYAQFHLHLDTLKKRWRDDYGVILNWPMHELNNSVILAFESYYNFTQPLVTAYHDLCDRDLHCFYRFVNQLTTLSSDKREQAIRSTVNDLN